jgi:hypothetical protein
VLLPPLVFPDGSIAKADNVVISLLLIENSTQKKWVRVNQRINVPTFTNANVLYVSAA